MSASEYQIGKRLAEDQQQQNQHRSDASQRAENGYVLVAHVQVSFGDLVHAVPRTNASAQNAKKP
jgi:hypothetical protein